MQLFYEFFTSSVFSTLVQLNFFIITYILDKFINSELSNMIGLFIDLVLDYIFQQYIFMQKITFEVNIISKYVLSEFFGISLNQILFTFYNRKIHKKEYSYTFARIVISIIIFTLLIFPLRKFFVYK